MTLDEWNVFKLKLIPGCTFLYRGNTSPENQSIGQINPDGKTANFKKEGWDSHWQILGIGGQLNFTKLSNFCWPNGSPMDTEYIPPTKQDLIISKCKSLDLRFKNKTLPKCKTKAISFPDKKERIFKVNFDTPQEYANFVSYITGINSPVRIYQSNTTGSIRDVSTTNVPLTWTFP